MNRQNLTTRYGYRAKQFAPFASMRGYYDMILKEQHVPEPRRVMTDHHAQELSYKLSQIRRGDMVTVNYYDGDAYVNFTGIVSKIDVLNQEMRIIKRTIPFEVLWDISGERIQELLPD